MMRGIRIRFLFMIIFSCVAENVDMLKKEEHSNALRGFCL